MKSLDEAWEEYEALPSNSGVPVEDIEQDAFHAGWDAAGHEHKRIEAEREAALAVIEQVMRYANRHALFSLAAILTSSPASALAKVRHDAWRAGFITCENGDDLSENPYPAEANRIEKEAT